MADADVWQRPRRVSLARGAVVLAWLAGAAVLLALAWSADSAWSAGSSAPAPPSFAEALATTFAALVIVPLVWCAPIGAVLDHHLSRFGALAVGLIHAAGCFVAFVVVMIVMTVGATVTGNDIPQEFALLAMFLLPPALVLGVLLAMVVPGSDPRHPGRGVSGVAPALRALAGGWRGVRG